MSRRPSKPWKAYGRYGSVGIELVLSILLGLYLGTKGDERFGTSPWLMFTGLIIGTYAGFRVVWKTASLMQRDAEREEARERDEWEKNRPYTQPRDEPGARDAQNVRRDGDPES